ncbi:hypothetical protein BD779DRAFT_1484242 [Infundibulicybe gibba]|nr:hypothetical protein BD779DRAFT_1484242 [Infundibulicybe gibba]
MPVFWRTNVLPSLFLVLSSFCVRAFCAAQFMDQAFMFDWNPPSQPVPIPVSGQCEVLHLKWGRGSNSAGPSPVAPYYLQVYTSTFVFPFIVAAGSGLSFDWAVPFAPGTQYQICMFDKNGNTGGCQATYTVIPSSNTSCANVTFPAGPLGVDAVVTDGPLSQFGWIPQCSDISVTPKNGTPPYTMTIAPALHPPMNITTKDMSSMNWTVSLTWASPFFISVADSAGNFWSNGPLHSGQGTDNCLVSNTTLAAAKAKLSPGIPVGAGVGGLVLGALGGILIAYLFMRRQNRDHMHKDHFLDLGSGTQINNPHLAYDAPHSPSSPNYRPIPSMAGAVMDSSLGSSNPSANSLMINRASQYRVEPFVMPGEDGRVTSMNRASTSHSSAPPAPPTSVAHESHAGSSTSAPGNQVYVVHHDGGRAPVTVYHQDGTEVVELPPRYTGDSPGEGRAEPDGGSDGRSAGRSDGRSDAGRTDVSDLLNPARNPGAIRKPRESYYAE